MLHYQVHDMTCGHCVQAIARAVKGVDAGAEVKVDLATKSVDVASQAEDDAIANAIRDAGYTPVASAELASAALAPNCCGHC
jgi:copper chaperone